MCVLCPCYISPLHVPLTCPPVHYAVFLLLQHDLSYVDLPILRSNQQQQVREVKLFTAVRHVRSLRSNVRKASKVSYFLYPLYSYLGLNSAKKNSLKYIQMFLKAKLAKYCHFLTFCKGYSNAERLQNGRFWEGSSDQPTRWLIRPHVKDTGTSKWREHRHYSFDPTQFISYGMN